jgi:hypothetical protein
LQSSQLNNNLQVQPLAVEVLAAAAQVTGIMSIEQRSCCYNSYLILGGICHYYALVNQLPKLRFIA